ncbi:unnamed protein product [Closterium sp. NIES-64]|nr:unnamed protein product [Closterium sp. NIES-64]
MEAAKDMYSPTTNPNGFINVSIAENMLMFDWLQEKLANRAPIEPEVARYNQITGMPRFKAAVAHTVQRLLLPRCPGLVSPENICVGAGVSAIVEHLAYTLCDAGEGVLIPAPFYPGFIGDFQLRNRVEIIPVATADQRLFQPTPEDCQSALEAAAARGVCVRTIVLTNPTNPHGTVWPEAAVAALVAWALQAGLHVIADEVYSASVFGDGVPECVSGVELAERLVAEGKASREEVDDRVHLTYGMSKDFTLNGFRVGILFSRNRKLLTALRMVNIFSWVSQDTQWALSSLLEDDAWVDAFLAENKKRLHRSHQLICSTLQELSIPFVPSGAAMFVFADMRRFLSAPTFEAEKQLWTDIKDGAKLVMVPGESCRAPEPGYFRLCFSSVPYEHLEVACARLFAFFNARAVKSLETPAG